MGFNLKKVGNRLGFSSDGNEGGQALVLHDGVSWKSVSHAIPVVIQQFDAQQNCIGFIAREACTVVAVSVVWATAEASAGTCTACLERLQGTEAPGSGDVISSTISVKGTANTVSRLTVVTTSDVNKLAVGNRLNVKLSAAPTELANFCVVAHVVADDFKDAAR
jgi:hypothetical protein